MVDWVPNHTSDQHPWFLEARASRDSPKRGLVRLARRHRPTPRRTTGSRPSPTTPPGRGTRRRRSGTCTCSWPSSPTSTGRTPTSSRPCTTRCASGSTAASTASAWTSSTCIGKDPDARPTSGRASRLVAQRRPAAHPRAAARHPRRPRRLRRRPHQRRRGLPARHRRRSPPTTATATSCTCRSTSRRCGRPGTRRRGARTCAASRAARSRRTAGPAGCCPTTTSPATAPATAAPRRAPGPPPSCCSPCGARRSSTPARSSACSTPRSRPTASSTPAAATAAAPRCPGTARPATAGPGRTRGCPGRPRPTPGTREAARSDPSSVAGLYRRLLAARHASAELRTGSLELLEDLPPTVVGYRRGEGAGQRTVLVNAGDTAVDVPVAGTVEVASDGAGEGAPFAGRLGADTAVLLRA